MSSTFGELRVRIVHLSDLHLLVDAQGYTLPPEYRPLISRIARLDIHSEKALGALVEFLPILIDEYSRRDETVLVVHTGDLEAFGYQRDPAHPSFPGHSYYQEAIVGPLDVPATGVFGNHDIWPGHPLGTVRTTARQLLKRFDYENGEPNRVDVPAGVDLLRLNSVTFGWLQAAGARGDVNSGPDSTDDAQQTLTKLRSSVRPESDLRVLATHHPPADFVGGIQASLVGALNGRDELATSLDDATIQVVLAGHRHKMDPPPHAEKSPRPPLPDSSLQLCAASATVDSSKPAMVDDALTFCAYGLYENKGTLTVTREIFQHFQNDLGPPAYYPLGEVRVAERLPLITFEI